jgi:hypothetical protein
MHNKIGTIKVIAALGIPLFPLGAGFFPPPNSAPALWESEKAPQDILEAPAAFFEAEGLVEPERPLAETPPPIEAETLARVFRAPNRAAARERPPGNDTIAAQDRPVPEEGKFSYLGSIRDSGDQEWLYIKEEKTGRIISIAASPDSSGEENSVVEIEGTSYLIRRK